MNPLRPDDLKTFRNKVTLVFLAKALPVVVCELRSHATERYFLVIFRHGAKVRVVAAVVKRGEKYVDNYKNAA